MENDKKQKISNDKKLNQNGFDKEFEKQVKSVKNIFKLYNESHKKSENSNEDNER